MGDFTMDVLIAFVGSAFLGSMITSVWRKLEGGNGNAKTMVLEVEIMHLKKEIEDLKKSIDRLEEYMRLFIQSGGCQGPRHDDSVPK